MQYSRIGENDRIYDFLADLNHKFDVVRRRILGQRSIPSLMKVYSEIRLKEDRTSAMNISATIDFVAFSTRSSNSGSDKHNGKPIPVREHCKKTMAYQRTVLEVTWSSPRR